MKNIFGKEFFYVLIAWALVEAFSLWGISNLLINQTVFWIVLILTAIFTLYKPLYGLLIVLFELIIGGKGYLFFAELLGTKISLRLGIFLTVLAAWIIISLLKNHSAIFKNPVFTKKIGIYYWLTILAIGWGVLIAYINNNPLIDIFLDANGYLFLGLVPMAVAEINNKKKLEKVVRYLLFATTAVAIETTLVLYTFSHGFTETMAGLYKWIRDTGVGEITNYGHGFYRIFFQSHLFNIVAWFILVAYLWPQEKIRSAKYFSSAYIMLTLNSFIIIIGLSRSFWMGLVGTIAIAIILLLIQRIELKRIIKYLSWLTLSAIIAVIFLTIVVKFPLPLGGGQDFSAINLLSDRTSDLDSEAAARSRWSLWNPLMENVKVNPIIGQGFGTKTAYTTSDLRYIDLNGTDQIETYSLEWTYLDMIVEFGFIGLLAYLAYLMFIAKNIWHKMLNSYLYTGIFLSLVCLLILNFFTPYLNHPIGIGLIIIASAMALIKPAGHFDKEG
ncbi:MAG: O-antigen ligase family protein [bacterium]